MSARTLLAEAQLLAALPGGLEALGCGLLTVAQSAVLLRAVGELPVQVQQQVWAQLQARLLSGGGGGGGAAAGAAGVVAEPVGGAGRSGRGAGPSSAGGGRW